MNPTSRAIFQSVLGSDGTLTSAERSALQRVLNGETTEAISPGRGESDQLLLSQKKAAKLLDVSRVTIWRMTKESALHPVEILPGTWRYPYSEIAALAGSGLAMESAARSGAVKEKTAA
jgi:predicted DNA-binding transcriptional regulator AlpA